MKKSSITASLIALFLFTTLLVGCSSGGNNAKESPSAPPDSASANADGSQVFYKEMTLHVTRYEHASSAVQQDTPIIKEIQKRTGVKLVPEGVPQSGWQAKKRTLISTNNIPDVLYVDQSDLNEFANTGIFLPISDYLDIMPNFKKRLEEEPEAKRLYVEGKLYGLPIMVQNNWQYGKAPVIRMDVLEKLNLEVPKTWDELYEVLKAMKQAYPESYPMSTRGISFLDSFAFGMNAGLGIYYDPDIDGGKYVYGTNKPAFKNVLSYLNKLYSEGLLDPDFALLNTQTWQEKMNTNKSFFMYDNNSFAANVNGILQTSDPNAKMELIPYFLNENGKSRGYLYPRGWIDESYAISSKVKDPEAVLKFYDWLYSPEGVEVSNFGVLGETYEIVDDKPRVLQSLIDKYESAADPHRAMNSDLGAGYLALSPMVDETPIIQMLDPVTAGWIDQMNNDPGAFIWPGVMPSLTNEESEKLKALNSRMNPIEEDIIKFIMGSRPMSEFDNFAKQLTDAGADELEQIYSAALARVE